MTDPAAVLRAAADLAEHKANNCPHDHRWLAGGDVEVFENGGQSPWVARCNWYSQAEHIAAADPAFMLTVAAWWRWVADNAIGETITWFADAALPSALTYLRQDTP